MVVPRGDQNGRQIHFWLAGMKLILQIPEALSTIKMVVRGRYFSANPNWGAESEPFRRPLRRGRESSYHGQSSVTATHFATLT